MSKVLDYKDKKPSFFSLRLSSFPAQAAVLSVLFLGLAIGSVYYFLSVSAERENRINQRNSLQLAQTAITNFEIGVSNWVKDYAWWDDTLANVRPAVNVEWAEDNIGKYLQETFGITSTYVLDETHKTVFSSSITSQPGTDAMVFIGDDASSFMNAVQSTDMSESIPLKMYVQRTNKVYFVAAAPITKENPSEQEMIRKPRPILILTKEITNEIIKEMSLQFTLDDLVLRIDQDGNSGNMLPLIGVNENPVAYLQWTSSRSGDKLIAELLPKIAMLIVALILVALIILFSWWHTATVANEAKSRFLAKMSHELRTPLNPIIGFSAIMTNEMMGPMPLLYRSYAKDIEVSGNHLSSIIEDVLDVSRIEAGQLSLKETEIDLRELLNSLPPISQQLTARDDTEPKVGYAPIVENVADNLPNLFADELRVRQVLLNLLSNATKFSDGKEVQLDIFSDNGQVIITVEDQGVGISKEDLPQLFTPFVQVGKKSQQNHPHGTGLGLVVSLELMVLHGGGLTIESTLGVGTKAIMRFPASRSVSA